MLGLEYTTYLHTLVVNSLFTTHLKCESYVLGTVPTTLGAMSTCK